MSRTDTTAMLSQLQTGQGEIMSIGYVECAHCGETVGTYYVTCPYCGYRLAVHSLPPR